MQRINQTSRARIEIDPGCHILGAVRVVLCSLHKVGTLRAYLETESGTRGTVIALCFT